jgi:hypothetical protein
LFQQIEDEHTGALEEPTPPASLIAFTAGFLARQQYAPAPNRNRQTGPASFAMRGFSGNLRIG